MTPDYYQVLGLAETSDLAAIKVAYRKRALECHPDRGGSHQQMLLVNEAFEILANPETRLRYDRLRQQSAQTPEAAQAHEDAAQARAHAEQYPRDWKEFEGWMDGLGRDFTDAKYGSEDFGNFKVPVIENSKSGCLFLLVGFGVGVWVDTQIFNGETMKGYLALFVLVAPPVAGAWLASFLHAGISASMKTSNPASETPAAVGAVPPESMIVACHHCGQKLRVRAEQRQTVLRCGNCKHEFRLPA